MTYLVTGNAGFIGFHVARRLLERGKAVVGFDVVNGYYDPQLKESRLAVLEHTARTHGTDYRFIRADLADRACVEACFEAHSPDRVIHLAAQAGVRYSLDDPRAYVDSNIVGFTNVLEACRAQATGHLVYASTSSVYGANTLLPYSEHAGVNHPLQFYAATKRANELMAHAYSHLFKLPTTGLRFFTVYGPWGRPDMALFKFTRAILAGEPITVFNNGQHGRAFTYIDDVVEGVMLAADTPPVGDPKWNAADPDPATSSAPFRLLNIGSDREVRLNDYIDAIEEALGRKAVRHYAPLQPGDAPETLADIRLARDTLGFEPKTQVREGVAQFVNWYREHYA